MLAEVLDADAVANFGAGLREFPLEDGVVAVDGELVALVGADADDRVDAVLGFARVDVDDLADDLVAGLWLPRFCCCVEPLRECAAGFGC